jgi:hypothetical protein
MTTVIDGSTGSSIAGDGTVVGDLTVGGAVSADSVFVPGGPLITESMTLLGTLNTTSGTTQTLSGLDLTGYRQVVVTMVDVNTATTGALSLGNWQFRGTSTVPITGFYVTIDLANSVFFGFSSTVAAPTSATTAGQVINISNASTSISVTSGGGAFNAGTVRIYGVK